MNLAYDRAWRDGLPDKDYRLGAARRDKQGQ